VDRKPPEPRMPKVAQLLAISYRTIPFLESCRRRFGDCFAVHMAPFGRLVYVADTSEIKRIFTGDPKQFHAGEANAFVLEQVLGKHSLLVLDEDAHMAERKLLLPHFHGESVRRYGELMHEIAEREAASWPRGRPIAMRPCMQSITLEVILRAVFGINEAKRLAHLRTLIPPRLS
jgi:cytochrome P450